MRSLFLLSPSRARKPRRLARLARSGWSATLPRGARSVLCSFFLLPWLRLAAGGCGAAVRNAAATLNRLPSVMGVPSPDRVRGDATPRRLERTPTPHNVMCTKTLSLLAVRGDATPCRRLKVPFLEDPDSSHHIIMCTMILSHGGARGDANPQPPSQVLGLSLIHI